MKECKSNLNSDSCKELCEEFNFNKSTIFIDGDKILFEEILENLETNFSILTNKNQLNDLVNKRK